MAIKNTKKNNTTTKAFTTLYNASSGQKEKSTNTPFGVSDSNWERANEIYAPSEKLNDKEGIVNNSANEYKEHTQKDMISSSTERAMNKSFKTPSAVIEANQWLSDKLKEIQSGKTSYSDQVKDMMDKIMNREKFSYDVDNDTLFQQALAAAMKSGKTAMQDTIGQASALTGGYGSTYATTVGNQAYNAFIEDTYNNNLPQYYQMELEAYQMEGEDMYRLYGMLSDAYDKEFNRNVAAYDATFQYKNSLYNEEYTKYRDDKSDAFTMANLEMQKYSQRANDLYNAYTMDYNAYESMYAKEYQSWADRVNNAWKVVEMEHSDAWADKNFDEGVRQYEKDFAERQRQHNEQMAYNYASLNQRSSGGLGGKTVRNGVEYKEPSETQMKKALEAYNQGGQSALETYIESLQSDVDTIGIEEYVRNNNMWTGWMIENDTTNHNNILWPGNDDNNDTYTFNGETIKFKELKKRINNSDLSKAEKDELLDYYRKQSKN